MLRSRSKYSSSTCSCGRSSICVTCCFHWLRELSDFVRYRVACVWVGHLSVFHLALPPGCPCRSGRSLLGYHLESLNCVRQ